MAEQNESKIHKVQENCPPENLAAPDEMGQILISPDIEFPADPKLVAEGWQRRFMADPSRVEESTRLYADLGFEVRAEAIDPGELSELCGDCRLATCLAYVTIYTRRPAS
jgi:hypothetical protein